MPRVGLMRRAGLALTLGVTCVAIFVSATMSAQSAQHPVVAPIALAATPVPARAGDGGSADSRVLPPAWVAFARAWAGIAGYSATVTVFERKGDQVQHEVLDYNFHKPSNVTVHVIEGPNAGVTVDWNGGSTMVAHRGSGFMAQFKRTLSIHDSLAETIRGSSLDQLSFAAILAHAQQIAGMVSQSSGPVIDGVATDAVRLITASAASDTGLTLEGIEISKMTNLPMQVVGYEGDTLVRRIDFSNVKVVPSEG
jgi:outer membrane lipoprotein-sorting protein